MKSKPFFFIGLAFLVSGYCFAQEKSPVKFGDVSAKDFATKVYSLDSNANAVVIADIGSSTLEGNTKSWFSLIYKHYKRVHILNKNAYDLANISIPLYADGPDEEQLDKLKAVTYNLEDGKVVETKLDTKANIFKDKIDKHRSIKKFTFPNVREGSIIEYEYTITSDFLFNLQPWDFQDAYPRLWSEYNLTLPSFFNYVFLSQGYLKFDVNDKKYNNQSYNIIISNGAESNDQVRINASVTDYRWVIKNVPALKEESYTSTTDNYISKIEFQLSAQQDPLTYHQYIESWPQVTGKMLESDGFGLQLDRDNGWLSDITGPLSKSSGNSLEKAKRIFAYVRDNFTCTGHSDPFPSLGQTLKNLVKSRNGNVSEINLLLAALLKHESINADPVILSTRSNGFTSVYPLLNRYNYVVCKTVIDGATYFLDASEQRIGFGYLPLGCYNGPARVVNNEATEILFNPDSIKEKKNSYVLISNDGKGNLIGRMQQTPGYYESWELRNRIKEKGQEQLMKDIKKGFGADIEISNPKIDSLDRYEDPLGISYDFDLKNEKEDILYLNPMLGEGHKENPFKSAERFYPVEMPCTTDETYSMNLEVPEGYEIDELPKQMIVKLNDQGDGVFEYRISGTAENISLRSRITFKRTYFMPDEYEGLREFFNLIVKKQSEQIVFKKKK